jgi:hypothetical protein
VEGLETVSSIPPCWDADKTPRRKPLSWLGKINGDRKNQWGQRKLIAR